MKSRFSSLFKAFAFVAVVSMMVVSCDKQEEATLIGSWHLNRVVFGTYLNNQPLLMDTTDYTGDEYILLELKADGNATLASSSEDSVMTFTWAKTETGLKVSSPDLGELFKTDEPSIDFTVNSLTTTDLEVVANIPFEDLNTDTDTKAIDINDITVSMGFILNFDEVTDSKK